MGEATGGVLAGISPTDHSICRNSESQFHAEARAEDNCYAAVRLERAVGWCEAATTLEVLQCADKVCEVLPLRGRGTVR